MATPKETIWHLDPHTAAKHEILRRYLAAWFPILGTYHGRIVYIDGFAGPGRYSKGEAGSPLIALDVATKQRKANAGELVFWFIEERTDRHAHLKRELAKLSLPEHFKVVADSGRFHEKFGTVLESMGLGGQQLAPTFAFIDPFGFSGIPFALIERLLRQDRCEAFITFMVDAINRFLESPDDKVVRHIVDAFGGDDAVRFAKGAGDRVAKLRDLYQAKLAAVAKHVRYFEMRDRNNRPQYYLFFATNNALGPLKMKEAMWKVDPDGEFRFSDATDPSQLVFFDSDPAVGLGADVRRRFSGKGTVTGRDVRVYVEGSTPYLKKHMTAALAREEETGHLAVEELKTDGNRRRAKTFPDAARLKWV